jgi:hypothetical protein
MSMPREWEYRAKGGKHYGLETCTCHLPKTYRHVALRKKTSELQSRTSLATFHHPQQLRYVEIGMLGWETLAQTSETLTWRE